MRPKGSPESPASREEWPGEIERQASQLVEQGLISPEQAGLLDSFAAEMRRLRAGRASSGAEVVVTSALALSDEDRSAVEKRLAARFGKGVRVQYRVDPQILGGLVIRVGDKVIDGSVVGKLESLKKRILEAI